MYSFVEFLKWMELSVLFWLDEFPPTRNSSFSIMILLCIPWIADIELSHRRRRLHEGAPVADAGGHVAVAHQAYLVELLLDVVHIAHELVVSQIDGGDRHAHLV